MLFSNWGAGGYLELNNVSLERFLIWFCMGILVFWRGGGLPLIKLVMGLCNLAMCVGGFAVSRSTRPPASRLYDDLIFN